jgi:hypothetical protein
VNEKKLTNVYRCFGAATDHPCSPALAISRISHPYGGSHPEPQEAVAKEPR